MGWKDSNNLKLREELQKITENMNNHGENVGRQIVLINNLAREYPHSIKIIEEAKQTEDDSWRYNCYMFAFDLRGKKELNDVGLRIYKILPDSQFAIYLLKDHLSEIKPEEVQDGDYVIYFEDGRPTHAGKVCGQNIVSKWGTAHRWQHGLYEVPLNYGNGIKFCKQLAPDRCLKTYLEWANQAKERRKANYKNL